MKKVACVIGGVCVSLSVVAADKYFKSSGDAAWSDVSNWYSDEACTVQSGALPASGDTANISKGASAVISEGDWIEGVTISIFGDASSFAKLTMNGGTITNCNITVGTSNAEPEDGSQALFTMNGGVIEGMLGGQRNSFTIQESGKFQQNGGLIHQYQATLLGWYNHVGGTNAVRGGAFYVNTLKTATRGYHIGNDAVVSTWLAYNANHEISSLTENVFKNIAVISDTSAPHIEVPNSDKGKSKLVMDEVQTTLPSMWIAYKRNSATHMQTGIVEVVNSKIKFSNFNDGNRNFANTNSYSAFIAKNSTVSNFVFSMNGSDADALLGRTRFDIVLSNSVFCTSAVDPIGDYDSYMTAENANTTIGRAVKLTIDKNSKYYAGAIMLNAGAKIDIDGGFLETATIFANDTTSTFADVPHSIVVRNGGVLMSSTANNKKGKNWACRYFFGARESSGVEKPTVNPSFFLLDNGNFHKRDNTYGLIQLGCDGVTNVSRFEVRGKSSMKDLDETSKDQKGFYVEVGDNDCAEFVFKGGEHDLDLSSLGDSTHRYLVEFVADKSPGHIAPLNFHRNNNSQDCGGDLRVSLDANVLLTTNTTFEIIKRAQSDLCTDFHSVPEDVGSTLWTTSRTSRVASISLAPALATLTDGATFNPTTPLDMGSVAFSVRSTNQLVRVGFELALKAADGTTDLTSDELSALAAELEDAGYTGSTVKDGKLCVNFPLELVAPRAVHRFAWDFTRTNGAKDLDNVTTKAKVVAVQSGVVHRTGLQFIIR